MSVVTEERVEAEVLEWFHAEWDATLSLVDWRDRLVGSGWAVPSWSSRWFGRDLPVWADRVAHTTIRKAGGVAVPLGGGFALAAPTMYDHGSEELKERFLRRTLTGELLWCQLFSEPGAGSDLAGLKATAVRDGDDWIVNGQKLWNTSAHHADMGILVARTDWEAQKHAGLSYFLIDMHQDAVEVRQIEQMNYYNSFNEVFMTNAVVPHENMVGGLGDGWKVARSTLAHERSFGSSRSVFIAEGASGRCIEEARGEYDEWKKTYVWYPQRQGRVDLLVERARLAGKLDDPLVRQAIARTLSFHRAAELTAGRAKAARELGRPPGSEGSIGKLALSEVARRCNAAHSTIAGADAMLRHSDDTGHATVAEILVSTPAQSIAGGTDEIQRNILGENMLGLPKEPAADRGMPFREVGR